MKALYFDLIAGASGDMILGALIDAGASLEALQEGLRGLHLDEFELQIKKVSKNGFQAIKLDVLVGKQPPERHLAEILEVIQKSDLAPVIRDRAADIFQRIAAVEAAIHDTSPEQIHLHELGGTDTIVDVVGALLALDQLEIDRIYCSPIPLSRGFIKGAHGQIPLPAPATIKLLEGAPVYGLDIQAELVTPTGAALLTTLTEEFGPTPQLSLESIGYGAGSRDLSIPNLLRVLTGELLADQVEHTEKLVMVESNLDDLNPEIYPFLMERCFQVGALDVSLVPVHMKKNRPGTQIQVLAAPELAERIREILFLETSTLGIRQHLVTRFSLPRTSVTVTTPYGQVQLKIAKGPNGMEKASPEYEDCRKLALKNDLPLMVIYQAALAAYQKTSGK